MPARTYAMEVCGERTRLTAVTIAPGQSDWRMPCDAACSATSEDEHAVSMLTHGPCSPNTYERRPAATEMALPVAAYTLVLVARSCA
eukprot:scaffold18282_cov79-Phaeocystis_antarctica.AAC.4